MDSTPRTAPGSGATGGARHRAQFPLLLCEVTTAPSAPQPEGHVRISARSRSRTVALRSPGPAHLCSPLLRNPQEAPLASDPVCFPNVPRMPQAGYGASPPRVPLSQP